MTELILVRHGETDWNRDKRFQGQLDIQLNATGQEQARRVASRLSGSLPGRVDLLAAQHIVSSDLLRARETAAPAAQRLGLTCGTTADLREQSFGMLEGLTIAEFAERHPEVLANWRAFRADFEIPGGESVRRFHARVLAGVRHLVDEFAGQTLLVVTHGGVLDMIYRTARAQPLDGPRQIEIPNGGINRVSAQVVQGVLQLDVVDWADTAHLDGMPAQPRYDQTRLAGSA